MLPHHKAGIQLCLCLSVFFAFLGLMYYHQNVVSQRMGKGIAQSDRSSDPKSLSSSQQESLRPEDATDAELPRPSVKADLDFDFDPLRHASDYGLERGQCHSAFPNLFREIDRAKAYWSPKRIASKDLDDSWKKHGLVRALIHNKKLHVISAKYAGNGYNIHRSLAILSAINRALVAYRGHLPNIEFTFSVNDVTDPEVQSHGKPVWSLSRRREDKHQWLMSDFGFWSWGLSLVGEYEQIRAEINETEPAFSDKTPKALWRGVDNSDVRKALLEVTKGYQKSWADVQPISWLARTKISRASRANAIPISAHCQYQYLLHTEGVSYSGRGKYLQNCNSVVIMHQRAWIESFDHLLVPSGHDQNVVSVKRDFTDLPGKMDFLLKHPARAEAIANNSVTMFRDRYLTPAAQACYWREMFHAWKEVSFEPDLWETRTTSGIAAGSRIGSANGNVTYRKMRGMPYETHVLTAVDQLYSECNWYKRIVGICKG